MMMSPKTWYFCLFVEKGRSQEEEKFGRITRSGYLPGRVPTSNVVYQRQGRDSEGGDQWTSVAVVFGCLNIFLNVYFWWSWLTVKTGKNRVGGRAGVGFPGLSLRACATPDQDNSRHRGTWHLIQRQ